MPDSTTLPASPVRNALHFWEWRRIPYNAALGLLAAGWVAFTWPHFRPAFSWFNLGRVLVLGLIANACYTTAYLIDLPVQASGARDWWLRNRWLLWLAGTLFAILVAYYWIGDEIYPYVTS